MHGMVDVAVRFSLRRQGRILMETMVVATRTQCLATRAKRGGTDEIRIMRLLLLHAMTSRELWTFRSLSWVGHIKGPSDPIFRGLASRYNKLFPSEKLEILPTIFEIKERAEWVVEHWGDDAA